MYDFNSSQLTSVVRSCYSAGDARPIGPGDKIRKEKKRKDKIR